MVYHITRAARVGKCDIQESVIVIIPQGHSCGPVMIIEIGIRGKGAIAVIQINYIIHIYGSQVKIEVPIIVQVTPGFRPGTSAIRCYFTFGDEGKSLIPVIMEQVVGFIYS